MSEFRNSLALFLVLAGIVVGALVVRNVQNTFVDSVCGRYAEAQGWSYQGRRYVTRFVFFGGGRNYLSCQYEIQEPDGTTRQVTLRAWQALSLPDLGLVCLGYGVIALAAGGLVWLARTIIKAD